MKEDLIDAIKYNHVCLELQELLDNTIGKHVYYVGGSQYRHIGIYKWWGIFQWLSDSKKANVYAVDEDGYGVITVYDKKLHDVLKEYGTKHNYSKFKIGYKNPGGVV